jgi:hypothetical protein
MTSNILEYQAVDLMNS